jgi:predicted enzyme related to lactoylglutathione lyase
MQEIDRAQKFYEEVLNIKLSPVQGSPEMKRMTFTDTSAMDKPGCRVIEKFK